MVAEIETLKQWPTPLRREVALFTDLTLYAEALALAEQNGVVTLALLQRNLRQRMQKMRLVTHQSERTIERLLRELRYFKWLALQRGSSEKFSTAPHVITSEGQKALALSEDRQAFRRCLAAKMHEIYVIPGWFIDRLWQINPEGQGEVILPAPVANWRPPSRQWADHAWSQELETQTLLSVERARKASPHAFPISKDDWLASVRERWDRLSDPRTNKKTSKFFSPRTRLALAMREASIALLFDRIPHGANQPDFAGNRAPIYLRTFNGWCPRLEALELIFYTDWHPQVSGRLLFPVSVFRETAPRAQYEVLRDIRHPDEQRFLWLHQPQWKSMRDSFLRTLITVHNKHRARYGALYVPLLDVRDEVCRLLRFSSLCFDQFLEITLNELPAIDFPWSMAVETDVLEGQSSGAGQLRRPVYLQGAPHTLIALAYLQQGNVIGVKDV